MTFRRIPTELVTQIRKLYAAPNRFYHSLNHLDHLNKVKDDILENYYSYSENYWDNHTFNTVHDYLSLAILFHDAEYNIWKGSPDNENMSAYVLWENEKILYEHNWTSNDLSYVAQMIWITAHHNRNNESEPFLQKLMLDIDISNFAESLDVCKYNQEQIYLEFKPRFPDKDKFLAGNVTFLQSLLNRPTLYYTPMFADKEVQARQNIEAMIKGS